MLASDRLPSRSSATGVRAIFLAALALALVACGATPAATPPAPVAATASPAALKVAMITPNRIFDKGYMELSWRGVQLAEQQLGAQIKAVEVPDNKLVGKNVDDLITQGYNVIIMVSPQLQDPTREAAKLHPATSFIGVDHIPDPSLPNLVTLLFHEDQAGYLAGALAGAISTSGKVGAVLGTDVVPQLYAFGEGFRKGAQDQKPGVAVTLTYHNDVPIEKSFIDPEWGRQQANTMMDAGIDVIFAAAGATGNGTLLAIAGRTGAGVRGIGVDTDQYQTLPEAQPILVSSSIKQLDRGLLTLLTRFQGGEHPTGAFYGTIALAPFHNFDTTISADVKQRLAAIQQQIEQGQLKIELPPQKK